MYMIIYDIGQDVLMMNNYLLFFVQDDLVTRYLELISHIEQSDVEIKSLEKRLHRQILTIRLCYNNIRKYLNLKKLNVNHCNCTLNDNSITNNKSQDQLSVIDLKMTEFHETT